MTSRIVVDADGRTWACKLDDADRAGSKEGRDVTILCTTPSVAAPVRLTVGWQWTKMADNGLARMIALASPAPRKKP
jgi:hypothetical protein